MSVSITPTEVWSSGGGVQSAAIAGLIFTGLLPKPDIALIIDTGRERASTWAYMETVVAPKLRTKGVNLLRIHKDKYATVDLYRDDALLLPVFGTTETDDGKVGKTKLPAFCSNEWKQRVARRYLREAGVKNCRVWLGMSTDEMKRVRPSGLVWLQHHYPLIWDVPMTRAGCLALLTRLGWPKPPRSSCWMCPNHDNAEWAEIKVNHPLDFKKAVVLERYIQKTDPTVFLHRSLTPLDKVDFSGAEETDSANSCESGYCYV